MSVRTPFRTPLVLGLSLLIAVACLGISALPGVRAVPTESAADAIAELVACQVDRPPLIDGKLDDLWGSAPVAMVPMKRGLHGTVYAFDLRMRAVYTPEAVYFYAEWPGMRPSFQTNMLSNRLTVHFDLEEAWPGARDVTCLVACHTAFMDEQGQSAYVSAETIPAGRTDPLPAAGGWSNGLWRLEWSRPLVHPNLFDVQFRELDQTYPFFVKVFEHLADLPDPVSAHYVLRFWR